MNKATILALADLIKQCEAHETSKAFWANWGEGSEAKDKDWPKFIDLSFMTGAEFAECMVAYYTGKIKQTNTEFANVERWGIPDEAEAA